MIGSMWIVQVALASLCLLPAAPPEVLAPPTSPPAAVPPAAVPPAAVPPAAVPPAAVPRVSAGQDTLPQQRAAAQARAASKELMVVVRGLLSKALAQNGPAGAIHICADSAQAVGAQLAAQHGLEIRRVSDRWRNPKDVPDAFEAAELEWFAAQLAAGVSPDSLEVSRTVTGDSVQVLRYLRPIVIGEMCLSCHGDASRMKGPVVEALLARYPNDRAVGYRAGELRGAVSVKVRLAR